jgi:hypothetical protein
MISTLHKLYRKDEWLQELFRVTGLKLDEVEATVDEIHGNNFFDTATEKAIVQYENELNLKPSASSTLADRRSTIRAKWIGTGKVDLFLLQQIADSWNNGLVELAFIDGKIHVKFMSSIGVPTDLEDLQKALENAKPAHLAIYYTFAYLTWGQTKAGGNWSVYEPKPWIDVKRIPT